MVKKKCTRKEEIGEDFCFICKDGGLLRFCDFKDCLKAYHPECVGREDSSVESEDRWTCDWHSCFLCHKTSKFRCVCCPQAVCGRCIFNAEFVRVRGWRGFCNHCLQLTLLIEDGKDVDIDGTKVDFNDRETYEFLFKEYWELMKKKQGLTAELVHMASNLLKKGRNFRNEIEESEEDTDEYEISSDYEELVDTEEGHKLVRKCKRSKEKLCTTRKKMKSSDQKFIGWGSKPVIEFLSTIGKDTRKKLSQHDVTSIITTYCKENKLFHPLKKKKIICDAKLQAVFGRKSMNVNTVHKHLTAHFAENMEQSSDDESTSSIEEKDDNSSMACKKPRKLISDRKPAELELSDVSHTCSAAIISANIKLVYLKRSLVERLLENPECFEGKMIGSFIRVKSDPNDYSQKNSYQLLQVTGIVIDSSNTGKQEILLQVTYRLDYIPIYNLSDDDFCEEECEDLRQRMKNGLLKNPTVMELFEKAKSLHEDITKHWITEELARLQTCIDHANEKGWRRELFEYMEKRLLLQKSSEQARLIHELPEVIADILEPTFDDLLKQNEQENHMLVDGRDDRKVATAAMVEECLIGMQTISEKQQHFEVSTCKDFAQKSYISAVEFQTHEQQHQPILPKEKVCKGFATKSCIPAAEFQPHKEQHQSILPKKHAYSKPLLSSIKRQSEYINIQKSKFKSKRASEVELIELSDNEDLKAEDKMQTSENPNFSLWYCASPQGETRGPLPLSLLKQWRDRSSFELKCKVWKNGQSSQEGIPLSDAIRLFFPE
ncbi:uncharacterized protein At5g08430-like [Cucurbita moschata]|uniref:Uncharacterized protein At5g08430-like n=1 Tax=Cucurbita moschata TaxID=3662 RepID=A0A6J1FP67_CUCMO|nr:uncharacterized protein At5g08430-like [Cucurbita moschata]